MGPEPVSEEGGGGGGTAGEGADFGAEADLGADLGAGAGDGAGAVLNNSRLSNRLGGSDAEDGFFLGMDGELWF